MWKKLFWFEKLKVLKISKTYQIILLYVTTFILSDLFNNYTLLYAKTQEPAVTYLESITEDDEGGRLPFPSFVFAEPFANEIYVIKQSSIIIYTSDFFPVFTAGKKDRLETPQGLTVDFAGNVYIAQGATKDNPKSKISVFNACIKWERDIYLEGFEGADTFVPYRLAIDKKGNILVAGFYYPGALVIDTHGNILDIISPEEEGRKVKINYVTIDKIGNIYLLSEEEGHIYVYDENRKFLFKFGEKGGTTGKLSRPIAVAVDNKNEKMYVVDYMRHTVSAYDKEGKYLFEFGGLGWGEGWFQHPRDIAVDSLGRIFVADTFNDRIQVFEVAQ